MAAAKFIMLVALLQMGACVPAPEPDPHNIDIQISQEVNSGCCNGVCPCKDKGDSLTWDGDICWIDDIPYPIGYILRVDECLELECVYDHGMRWIVFRFIPECGNCTFGGEPLVYKFDTPIGGTPISVGGLCEHRMADRDYGSLIAFGVNSHFTDWPAGTHICGAPYFTNCINGVIYYEERSNIAVKLTIYLNPISPTSSIWSIRPDIHVFTSTNPTEHWHGSSWVHQIIGSGKRFGSGNVLVVEGLPSIPGAPGDGRDCTIVIGSEGLTVGLCKTAAFDHIYAWSFISAMPNLRNPPSITPLEGICQAWTVDDPEYFTDENGTNVYDWQNGTCVYDWRNGTCVYGAPYNSDFQELVPRVRNDLIEGFKVLAPPGSSTTSPTPTTSD